MIDCPNAQMVALCLALTVVQTYNYTHIPISNLIYTPELGVDM